MFVGRELKGRDSPLYLKRRLNYQGWPPVEPSSGRKSEAENEPGIPRQRDYDVTFARNIWGQTSVSQVSPYYAFRSARGFHWYA